MPEPVHVEIPESLLLQLMSHCLRYQHEISSKRARLALRRGEPTHPMRPI